MKNLIITAILTSVSGLSAFAQTQQAPSFILNQHLTGNQHYKASQFIEMGLAPGSTTGFEYNAQTSGGEFIAEIDPFMVFPPEEGEFGGPNSGDDGVVGSIAGVFDVSDLGAATYTIPINLPKGVGNNTPQVSLNYSSMSGNGAVGLGWNIGAVSAIARTGKTIYCDGVVSGPQFNSYDNLVFNGMRMMPLKNDTYTTEVEGFSRIKIKESNATGPVWFEVRTKEGRIMRFGKTPDSRQKLEGTETIIAWYLSSVEDISGNYISYTYETRSGNLLLKEICYGGNSTANQEHIYKVKFNYIYNRVDPFTSYINGAALTTDFLLDNITINYIPENMEMFKYSLEYDESAKIYSRLIKIKVADNVNSVEVNPTSITWGESTENFTYTPTNITKKADRNSTYTLGDFNGDGKTDILSAYYYYDNGIKKYDSWSIFYLNAFGFSYNEVEMGSLSEPYQPAFAYFLAGDFNGDGIDDLIQVTSHGPDMYGGYLYISDGNNNFSFGGALPSHFSGNHYINITDMDGNGINEVMLVKTMIDEENDKKYVLHLCYEKKLSNNSFESLFTNSPASEGYLYEVHKDIDVFEIQPGDFNGDGRTDLLINTNDCESTIFTLHPTEKKLIELNSQRFGYPTNYHRVYTGDFNGDGITDILTYVFAGLRQWEVSYFNGKDSWIPGTCPITYLLDPEIGNSRHIYTTDINGDGKSDILDIYYRYSGDLITGSNFDMYYSNGNGFKTKETEFFESLSPHKSNIHNFFDFNGDGKAESLIWDTPSKPMHIMSYHKEEISNLAASFTNGMGNKTSVIYLPLTDAQVYFKNTQVQFPLCNIQPPVYVVKRRLNDILDDHVATIDYIYRNLLIHKQGKGLLGFKENIITDIRSGTYTVVTKEIFSEQDKFFYPYPKKVEINNRFGNLILKTENVLNHKSYSSSPLRYFPFIESSHSFEKDITTNDFVKTTHSAFIYDDYGNLLTKNVLVDSQQKDISSAESDYSHQSTTTVHYKDPDLANWYIGLPDNITSKVRHLTEEKDEATTEFVYYLANEPLYPFLKEKRVFPGNNLVDPLVTFESYTSYDDFGNMLASKINAPYSQPLLEERNSSVLFDSEYHHRFPTSTTNALGNTTTSTYDPVYGTLNTSTDPNGLTSTYNSNPLDTFSKTISPDGIITTTVTRWSDGHPHEPINALYYKWQQTSGSPEVLVFYHKTGVELRSVTFGFDGSAIYVDKIYNDKGLLHKESLPYIKGGTPIYTEYLYDDYNRLETLSSPDGTITTTTYGANKVTVTINNGDITRTSTKKYNGAGWLTEIIDNFGGIVKNEYYCNGYLKKSYIEGRPATTISIDYDNRGNRTLLIDPNYGSMATVYNAYGELVQQTNPLDETTIFAYDKLGRMTNESGGTEGNIIWTYSTTPDRIGTLENIIKNNHRTNYVYDDFLRLTSETEIIDGVSYATQYTYDELGRPYITTHPTGIKLRDEYNDYGYHTSVSLENNSTQIWKTENVNAIGLVTQFKTGNDLVTDQTYCPLTMRPYTVKTAKESSDPVQDLEYGWFGLGNMEYRKKWLNRTNNTSLTESFTYDGLDRLEYIKLNGAQMGYHEYDKYGAYQDKPLGNITLKNNDSHSIFNNAIYGLNGYGPHAITEVTTANPILTGPYQDIVYNGYDKVKTISEGDHSLQIQYGHHKQRIAQQYTNGVNSVDKVWAGTCEFITKNGQLYKHTYLSGPMGVFAIHIINPDGTEEINYIHKDHLGSWNTITDKDGNLLQELSFDAWGNRRDPGTWRAYTTTDPEPLFDRGFTGHEHLYAFNLINMNGRMYDPVVSRMLSPDNFVQAPDFSQSFNRYSYCWNNPLKYIDPTGNELGLIDGNNGYGYDLGYSGGVGPGSGNHWSDQYRSVYGNFMLMSGSNFQSYYNISSSSYNQIVSNYKSLPRNSSNFQTGPNGPRGFYASNSYETYKWNSVAGNEVYRESYTKDGILYLDIYYEGAWLKVNPENGGPQGQGGNVQYAGIEGGEHFIGPSLILLGQPLKALKPVGALGSKPGSSIASYTLSKTFPQTFTKVLGKQTGTKIATSLGTNVIGRAAGRFVPYVGWAWTAWDVGWYLGENYGPSKWFTPEPPKSVLLEYMRENGMLDE